MKSLETNNGQWFTTLLAHLGQGLLERDIHLRLSFCAALAGESVFLYGPPGTAKSLLARRLQTAFSGARIFDYLMGRFSTPEELFGPISIAGLRDHDRYERKYQGYLPDADIVFLDEIWKAGPPIQNALLTALNEKVWRNGQAELKLPMKCLLAASNETCPNDESRAFWDRFLLRLSLEPLKHETNFMKLLEDQSDPYADTVPEEFKISATEWMSWQDQISLVELDGTSISMLAAIRQGLGTLPGTPQASDRRWKKIARLLRAAAFLHGRTRVEASDFAVVPWCLWNEEEHIKAIHSLVEDVLGTQLYGHDPDIASLKANLEALDGERRQRLSVKAPLLVDDEYYLIDHCPLVSDDGELRIWHGDFDELGPSPQEVELFIYHQGRYLETVTHELSRVQGNWAVLYNGQNCPLRMPPGTSLNTATGGREELGRLFRASLAKRQELAESWDKSLFAGVLNHKTICKTWDQVLEAASVVLESAARG